MEAKAVEKFIRISPQKIRLVVDLVRDKKVEDAVNLLSFTPKKGAAVVKKAVNSAAANATENHGMEEDDLFISKIFVNEGPTLKRFRPRARGRATRIRKRTSHITVFVSDGKQEEVEDNGPKS
ncbi:MAG: 50S ribosomal protein L22 [Actinomycetia bacterium]|nr:50S ribosomal protein L22 [Actinomycetes bacterium]